MNKLTITATVFYENGFWTGIFERQDEKGYHVAKHIFGSEPTDPELYQFILKNYQLLHFSSPIKDFQLNIKHKKFKRMQRDVKHELKKQQQRVLLTYAQDTLRQELEKNKKIKKNVSKAEKEEKSEQKFLLKKVQRKQKKRGK